MKINCGRELDGQHGTRHSDCLNELTTGPLGLLNVLETQMGLLRDDAGSVQRVLQYRDCLKRIDTPERFYHQSFQTDELGTAATLLSWRDQWHLHGWQGKGLGLVASRRLSDMQAVENEAVKSLAPGLGERLCLIAQSMHRRTPQISALNLCERLETWPMAWQKIFTLLPVQHQGQMPSTGSATGLLGKVQAAFRAIELGNEPKKLRWQADGSLIIVQSETRLLAGAWLAGLLADQAADTLLLASDGGLLDDTLVASNLPRQGFKTPSAFRPALQVVPLVLDQLWQPMDVFGLLKFLTHPVCPLSSLARRRLAEMLSGAPGIGGGKAWQDTLDAIKIRCEEMGHDWKNIRESIRFWVEHQRYRPSDGAPIPIVIERLQALMDYFQGRLADQDPVKKIAFNGGFAQARACRDALSVLVLQGETLIGQQQLQTLVVQATAQGSANPLLVPEVGASRTITQPGAAVGLADRVIWWQLAAPGLPSADSWSQSEIAALGTAGVVLPPLGDLLNQQAQSWQLPVFAAQKQLVLILPPPGSEVHPLWLMLEALFEKDHRPKVKSIESLLNGEGDYPMQVLSYQPLPEKQRWWQLPAEIKIPRRDEESYSSLEWFLFNPYQWVLRYPAALKPSTILTVSDTFLLSGNLAHHLVERYYGLPNILSQSDADFQKWFEPAFDALVANEGAVLLMPGRRVDLENFRRKLKEAMRQLRCHLAEANVVRVEPEVKLSGLFTGGAVAGFADLLVTNKKGEQAVVDMKWAGGKKYPDKLALNRHLQLAIYGEIQRQKTSKWPKLAYFILNDARMIASENDFFPSARVVSKKKEVGGEGTPELWQRFLSTWKWRRAQLDEGTIEVALEIDPDSDLPDDSLALEILNQAYNDYRMLAGWEEMQ